MERRATRSSARQAASRAAGLQDVKPEIMNDGPISRLPSGRDSLKAGNRSAKTEPQKATKKLAAEKRKTRSSVEKVKDADEMHGLESLKAGDISTATEVQEVMNGSAAKKRKTRSSVLKVKDADELPHNLGPTPALQSIENRNNHTPRSKNTTVKIESPDQPQESVDDPTTTHSLLSQTKKSKKSNTYGLTPGVSPFPDWNRPTAEECEEVNRLLSTVHGEIIPPATIPEPSLTVTGCGEVPSVLDALIRTLLSGATTGANSALAFSGLVQRFGLLDHGIGKGSVDWDAVRRAPLQDVFEAIKSGGLAAMKSKNIKAILDMVYEENQLRRAILVKGEEDATSDLGKKSTGGKLYEIACADQNFLSLNHLHDLPTEDAMTALVKYPGIGPKTAACVLLFCLQRPCFAVDTHIFRICKWLGWVPPTKATEITAFSHLEVRIPDNLKYSLHQLLIRHGKACPRCRAITGQSSAGWDDGCVIDHLVKRTGKRKG